MRIEGMLRRSIRAVRQKCTPGSLVRTRNEFFFIIDFAEIRATFSSIPISATTSATIICFSAIVGFLGIME